MAAARDDGILQDFYRYMIDAAAMDFGASTDHQGGALAVLVVVHAEDDGHVSRARRLRPDLRLRAQRRISQRPSQHFLRQALGIARDAVLAEGRRSRGSACRWARWRRAGRRHVASWSRTTPRCSTKRLRGAQRHLAIPHTSAPAWARTGATTIRSSSRWSRSSRARAPAPSSSARRWSRDAEGMDDAHMKQAGYQPEGMVSNAWAKGYKLGIIASSDHGSTHISYAMVYTDDPTRQGILDAIRKRHTYGAMDNIILDVRMGEHFMGDEFPLSKAAADPRQGARHEARSRRWRSSRTAR